MLKILLATDGSEHSYKAVQETIRLIGNLDAEITVLSVAENIPVSNYYQVAKRIEHPDPMFMEKLKKSLEDAENNLEKTTKYVLEKTEGAFQEKGLSVKTIMRKGHPADIICEVAENGAFDLVILGSRGLGGLKELILGSVSNKVAHCVKTNVLIIK